jgi:hypothetical protein
MAIERYDPLEVQEAENEVGFFQAGAAGIASGLIKIPEGVVSLAAELIDLGMDTDTAADVDRFFDKINPFEEIAQERAIGKITEALTQVASVGTAGFKIGTKLATKALKAKKAGNLVSLKNPNLIKAARKASELNKAAKYKRFAAGVVGGAAGETFVADVENIGTFGDMFHGGPTVLDNEEDPEGGRGEALRKLMNRAKFGSESLLITPFVYGVGTGVKALATRGKRLAFSDSQFEKHLDKLGGWFRARGGKAQKQFELKMAETGGEMADTHRARELVANIDKQVNAMYPSLKKFYAKTDKVGKADRQEFLKDLDDLMFSGTTLKKLDPALREKVIATMKRRKMSKENIDKLFGAVHGAREQFTDLIDIISGPTVGESVKNIKNFKEIIGDRFKQYLGSTYKIMENKSLVPFANYKPATEAMDRVKAIFSRYAAKNGQRLTPEDLDFMVDKVIRSARLNKPGKKLPTFKYSNLTLGAEIPEIEKTFARTITRGVGSETETQVLGKGSKAFRELFGEINDPRYSLFQGVTKLSTIARKKELMEGLARENDTIIKAAKDAEIAGKPLKEGARGWFFPDELTASRNLKGDYNEIVPLNRYLKDEFIGDGVTNPLKGLYTTKDFAEGIVSADKGAKFFRGELERRDAKVASWVYRNLFLYPKGLSQISKTVLGPFTHSRNFFSAGAFAGANGIFFHNPGTVARAFKKAFGEIQVGTRSEAANKEYRELLRLGVVNSNTKMGDLKNLLKDVKFGEGIATTDNMLRPLFKAMGKVKNVAQDLYVAEDDFWKITNYAVEMERMGQAYAKAGVKRTAQQLKEEAADIVKNTVPNYAFVSDTVRALRRFPIGNFMSFPSEIIRTTGNIARRAIHEIRDPITGKINPITSTNPLKGIGMRRLLGMSMTHTMIPAGLTAGGMALYDVSRDELDAIRRFLPQWSKNSTIIPIRDEETGELKYVDSSHGNAYDTIIRPFVALNNSIQRGIEDEEVLIEGFARGIAEATGELLNPFVSESIYTEAFMDIVGRGGRTKEGKQLWTEQTSDGEKYKIAAWHALKSVAPGSPKQFQRLFQAATDQPGKSGDFYEVPDELAGFFGFRAVKLDPVKSMGFKISEYQTGIRNARREFTGGEYGVIKGGPKTANDVIRRYIAANRARFNVQKEMMKNLQGAQLLGTSQSELFREFKDRQLSGKTFGMLNRAQFDPYFPSLEIIKQFREIAQDIDEDNPFEEARDTLNELRQEFRNIGLDEDFDDAIDVGEWLEDEGEPLAQLGGTPLQTPDVNPALMSQVLPSSNVMETGLTPTEQALLSDEEKGIRLRQRGMTA